MKLLSQEDYKKHTNLMNEIEMHKPKTDWVPILVGVVVMIAICHAVFVVLNLSLLV